MKQSEMKNAPWLTGWVIAAGAGLVAGAVTYVVGDFSLTKAGFIAVIVCVAVGLFIGMPSNAAPLGSKPPHVARPAPAPLAPVTGGDRAVAQPAVPVQAVVRDAAIPAASVMAAPVLAAAPAPRAPEIAEVARPTAAAVISDPVNPDPLEKAVAPAPVKVMVAKTPKVAKADGPERLSAPRGGKADDLKEIEGVGPALEKLCNTLGFYHFDQIASWSDADVEWVDANMKTFKGRILRDKWIAQCKIITTQGLEAFRARAKTNDY